MEWEGRKRRRGGGGQRRRREGMKEKERNDVSQRVDLHTDGTSGNVKHQCLSVCMNIKARNKSTYTTKEKKKGDSRDSFSQKKHKIHKQ